LRVNPVFINSLWYGS